MAGRLEEAEAAAPVGFVHENSQLAAHRREKAADSRWGGTGTHDGSTGADQGRAENGSAGADEGAVEGGSTGADEGGVQGGSTGAGQGGAEGGGAGADQGAVEGARARAVLGKMLKAKPAADVETGR